MTKQEQYSINHAIMCIVADPNGELFDYLNDYAISMPILVLVGIDTRQIRTPITKTLETRHYDAGLGDKIEYIPRFKRDMVIRPIKPGKYEKMFLSIPSNSDSRPMYIVKTDFLGATYLESALKCMIAMNEKKSLRSLFYS